MQTVLTDLPRLPAGRDRGARTEGEQGRQGRAGTGPAHRQCLHRQCPRRPGRHRIEGPELLGFLSRRNSCVGGGHGPLGGGCIRAHACSHPRGSLTNGQAGSTHRLRGIELGVHAVQLCRPGSRPPCNARGRGLPPSRSLFILFSASLLPGSGGVCAPCSGCFLPPGAGHAPRGGAVRLPLACLSHLVPGETHGGRCHTARHGLQSGPSSALGSGPVSSLVFQQGFWAHVLGVWRERR